MIQVTGLTNDGRTVTILRGRAPPGLIRGAVLPVVAGSFVTLAEWDPIAKDNLFRVPDGSVGGDEGRGEVPNILVGFGMTCNGLGQWEGFQRCVPKMCVAASGGSLETPSFSLVSPGQLHSRSCPVGYDITCLLCVIALRFQGISRFRGLRQGISRPTRPHRAPLPYYRLPRKRPPFFPKL